MTDGDELGRRRLLRAKHPSTQPPADEGDPPMWPDDSFELNDADLPSMVRARLEALQGIVAEVADELEQRGLDDLAERLRGALP